MIWKPKARVSVKNALIVTAIWFEDWRGHYNENDHM
jgi:hypothetical protein